MPRDVEQEFAQAVHSCAKSMDCVHSTVRLNCSFFQETVSSIKPGLPGGAACGLLLLKRANSSGSCGHLLAVPAHGTVMKRM